MKRYQELNQQARAKLNEVTTAFDTWGDTIPEKGNEEYKRIIDLNKAAEDLLFEAESLKEAEDMRDAAKSRSEKLTEIERKFAAPGHGEPEKRGLGMDEQIASLGKQFVENVDVKTWIEQFNGHGPSNKVRVQSPQVNVDSKTLLTGLSSTSAGAFVVNQRLNIVDRGIFYRPLAIRDIVTIGDTNSDTVEYVREGSHTNVAAAVAEATATSGASGVKPESAMALLVVTETVKTLAHWIPATRRALSDAGQLRTLVDNFLRYGLAEELEDQMLTGNGVGENFTGVRNVSGITTQAWDTNILTTTRKGRTKVGLTGRARPSAYVMHPTDWETIDLLQDNEARYFFGGPSLCRRLAG